MTPYQNCRPSRGEFFSIPFCGRKELLGESSYRGGPGFFKCSHADILEPVGTLLKCCVGLFTKHIDLRVEAGL